MLIVGLRARGRCCRFRLPRPRAERPGGPHRHVHRCSPGIAEPAGIDAGRHDDVAAVAADIDALAELRCTVPHLETGMTKEPVFSPARRPLRAGMRQRTVLSFQRLQCIKAIEVAGWVAIDVDYE